LWEEARTALTATQTVVHERSVDADVFRYSRRLDPKSLNVIGETRSDVRSELTRPFVSVGSDSLSRAGYWQDLAGDTVIYHAPDATVLLSDTFLADHCFSVATDVRKRPGMIGLSFEPIPRRPVPDIRGTMWLDAETFQLRVVDYRYTRLPRSYSDDRIGGEVWIAALPSGAWIVRRWHIRMPQFADVTPLRPVARDRNGVTMTVRETEGLGVRRRSAQVHRIVEQGGSVFADAVRFFKIPADISGTVQDSSGRPLTRTRVTLAGSPFHVVTDDNGRFRFDSLPSGAYTLLVRDTGYDSLGVLAADVSVNLNEGDHLPVTLRAKTTVQVVTQLCELSPGPTGRAVLRLLFRHRNTSAPLASLPVNVYWLGRPVLDLRKLAMRFEGEKPDGVQGLTDSDGAFTVCGGPPGIPLFIRALLPSLAPGPTVAQCELRKGEVAIRVVRTEIPRGSVSPQVPPDTLLRVAPCELPRSQRGSPSPDRARE
jgi:hypothetical protein